VTGRRSNHDPSIRYKDMRGGMEGTRTLDLLRDRQAF
jgi:hypothetical protein